MHFALRIVVLFVAAAVAFAVSGYAQHFVAIAFFPVAYPRPVNEMVVCAVVGAAAAALVASFPLAAAFRNRAWLAAAFVAAPVLVLRVPDVLFYSGASASVVMVMGAVESISYLLSLVVGAWLVSRWWPRSNPSLQRSAFGAR